MQVYNPDGNLTEPSFKNLVDEEPKSVLEAARRGTRIGLAMNPCEGKKPILKGWLERKLTEDELPENFPEGRNVGIVLGELSGGLVNVDIDVPEALKVSNHFFPNTLCGGREGTPGAHRYYWAPGAKNKRWLDATGHVLVELLSTGSQVLFPSSVHPGTGESYRFVKEGILEPVEISAAELSRSCGELATAAAIARRMLPEGRHYLALALAGYLLRRLNEEAVLNILVAAWEAAEALDDGVEAELERIIRDTASRLEAGEPAMGGPKLAETDPDLLKVLDRFLGNVNGRQASGYAGGYAGGGDEERVPTHDELRDRWLEGCESPTAHGQGEWRRCDKGFWFRVHQQVVEAEVDEVLVAAKAEDLRPTVGTRSSVERMARAKTFVPDEKWDANPDILVCSNGTLDIPSFTLREHRPEDYALSAVPFAYDPEAEAPRWRRFCASTIPDAQDFLQEFAGYSLTVDTLAEIAVWLYGPPGSGKSTFIEGLKAMLGRRAGLLGLAEIQRSRFALSKIPGKTLLTATEQPSDYLASTDVLNAIISGEEVQVEEKFKPSYTVIPRAKLLWAMNELPRIGDANSGLFRRVKVVKFPRLQGKPDPLVKEEIKTEGAGILNWALEGLRRLRERDGFEVPAAVQEATEDFKKTNDVPAAFVEEVCITGDPEALEEQSKKLYDAYKHWCRESGHKPLSMTRVAREWERLGFERKSRGGRTFYSGVHVDEGWISAQTNYPRT